MSNSSCWSSGYCASFCKSFLKFIGRNAIATIFILAGLGKLFNPEATSLYMAAKGMTNIPFFLYSSAIVEILCGLALVLGYKARWGALVLLLFLIPTTVIFHDFWNLGPVEAELEKINFLKNLAIFGGLLYVLATGAGGWSLDSCCHRNEPDHRKDTAHIPK